MSNRTRNAVLTCASVLALTCAGSATARILQPGEKLVAGEVLYSDEGRYFATLQHDGNFVVYRNAAPLRAIWSTNTTGLGAVTADMQSDGNFVLHNSSHHPVWHSGSNGANRSFTVTDIGQAVVIAPGQVHWSLPGALLPLYRRLRATPIFRSPHDTRPGPGGIPAYCTANWKSCDAWTRARG